MLLQRPSVQADVRLLLASLALLVLSASTTVARAEAAAPIPVRPRNLWLEPALSVGPYHWRATTTYVSTDEPEPDEHYGHSWTMIGGAFGLSIGGWLGEHVALGGSMRIGLAAGPEHSIFLRVSTRLFLESKATVLFAQERKRGLRVLLSGGLGLLVDTYATTAGPAAGLELGYAFPAGQHAFAVGFGADFVMGLSRGDGDHGYYKDRDYLLMPEVSLRFLL